MKKFYGFSILLWGLIFFATSLYSGVPRVSLVEEYTGTSCGVCASKNPKLVQDLTALGDKVVPLVIHVSQGDPFYEYKPLNSSRVGLYVSGSYGIPAMYCNGKKENLEDVTTAVNSYQGTSPYEIIIIEKRDASKITGSVIVYTDINITGKKQLFLAVTEKHIHYPNAGSNGEEDFYWVARHILPSPTQGVGLALKAKESATVGIDIDIDPKWDLSQIEVVAFIQDMDTKEVVQAARKTKEEDTDPAIAIPSTKVDFEKVSDFKEMEFKVQNTGFMPLVIEKLTIENDADYAFEVLTKTPVSISYKMETSIKVRFTPKQNKPYNCGLKISSNAGNGKSKSVTLIGTGSGVEVRPDLAFMDQTLDFGTVSKETTKSVTIKNTGFANLIIGEISIEDDSKGAYSIVPKNYDPIPKGGTAVIDVKFKPRKNITYYGTLRVASNAPTAKMLDIVGVGQNVIVEDPEISVSETVVDFGEVSSTKNLALTVTNSGKGDLQIESFDIQTDGNDVFKVESQIPGPIAEGESADIEISFKPLGNEEYTAFLTINSNAVESPAKVITLMGIGKNIQDAADITILDKQISFTGNTQQEKFITILNSGTGKLVITGVAILNNPEGAFELVDSKIEDIQPGKSGKISVRFVPKDYKVYIADLYFRSNTGPGGSLVDHTIAIKADPTSVADLKEDNSILNVEVNPNPVESNSTMNYFIGNGYGGELTINLYDNNGGLVRTLFQGNAEPGSGLIPINVQGLGAGQYYILAVIPGYKAVLPVVIMK